MHALKIYETSTLKIYTSIGNDRDDLSDKLVASKITATIAGILQDFEPNFRICRSFDGFIYRWTPETILRYWNGPAIEKIKQLKLEAGYSEGVVSVYVECCPEIELFKESVQKYVTEVLRNKVDGIAIEEYRWLIYF